MNDVGAGDPADNDVASSLVVSADGAATVTGLTLDAANDSLVSITGGDNCDRGYVLTDAAGPISRYYFDRNRERRYERIPNRCGRGYFG